MVGAVERFEGEVVQEQSRPALAPRRLLGDHPALAGDHCLREPVGQHHLGQRPHRQRPVIRGHRRVEAREVAKDGRAGEAPESLDAVAWVPLTVTRPADMLQQVGEPGPAYRVVG